MERPIETGWTKAVPRRLSGFGAWRAIVGMALCVPLGLGACGGEDGDPIDPGTELRSDKQRITNTGISDEKLAELCTDNRDFAMELYQQLATADTNLFFSPFSISQALAMTYAGARGDTASEIKDVLHFDLGDDLHPAFNALDLALQERGQGAQGADGEGFRLHVVNAIWGQRDFDFVDAFLDVLAQHYGAGLRILDFMLAPDASRETINAWVEAQTEDRIKNLLPAGSITEDTRLVLTNAIYFNAAWAQPFDPANTHTGVFSKLDGSTVSVPMMEGTHPGLGVETADYDAAEILYDGSELSMVVIAPKAGKFAQVEAQMTREWFDQVVDNLGAADIILSMPKFEFEVPTTLTAILQQMGMVLPFSDVADFSGIAASGGLAISDVLHKAFISVNEAGTEAAAATAVIVGVTSVPPQISVVLDRPFIFAIRDRASGALLFVGRILDPS